MKVIQSYLTRCNPTDGILQARILEWVAFPSPGDLPNQGTELRSPALQVDSLPAKPQGSPRILAWVAFPFSSGSSQPRDWSRVSCIAGGFFTNWAIREARGPRIMKLWGPRMKRNYEIMKSSNGSRYLRDAYWGIRSTTEGIRMI